jgi:hypothetical protein
VEEVCLQYCLVEGPKENKLHIGVELFEKKIFHGHITNQILLSIHEE